MFINICRNPALRCETQGGFLVSPTFEILQIFPIWKEFRHGCCTIETRGKGLTVLKKAGRRVYSNLQPILKRFNNEFEKVRIFLRITDDLALSLQ